MRVNIKVHVGEEDVRGYFAFRRDSNFPGIPSYHTTTGDMVDSVDSSCQTPFSYHHARSLLPRTNSQSNFQAPLIDL